MYWNNDYRHKVKKKDIETTVLELASEVHIVGGAGYFNGNILIGSIADGTPDSLQYHQVKLIHDRNAQYDTKKASTKGYYHPDGVAGEFTSLMALYFRTRFYHLSTTYGNLTNRSIQGRHKNAILRVEPSKHIDTVVFGNQKRNFVEFQEFMKIIDSIPEEHHRSVISAASNYNLALREIGIDHEMVFVRLVSAVEAFSSNYTLSPKDDPLSLVDTRKLLAGLAKDIKDELRISLDARKSRLKFTRFLEVYSKGYFKGGNHNAKHTKIKRAQLGEVSKAVYTARSKYLHSGERMYLSQAFLGTKYDTDPSSGMYIGMRKFTEKEKLPNIQFFEGLVRHCILSKLDELSATTRS